MCSALYYSERAWTRFSCTGIHRRALGTQIVAITPLPSGERRGGAVKARRPRADDARGRSAATSLDDAEHRSRLGRVVATTGHARGNCMDRPSTVNKPDNVGVSDPRSSPGAKSGAARRGSLTPNPPLLHLGAGPSCGAERRPTNTRRGNTGPDTFIPPRARPSAGATGRVHAGSRSYAAARRTRRGLVRAPARRAPRVRWPRTPSARHPPANDDAAP